MGEMLESRPRQQFVFGIAISAQCCHINPCQLPRQCTLRFSLTKGSEQCEVSSDTEYGIQSEIRVESGENPAMIQNPSTNGIAD
jgi:hypothetical protein